MNKLFATFLILIISFSINCHVGTSDFENAKQSINVSDLETWVKELGSDRFMGRAAFTEGEKLTVEYLADQLKKIGFEPAFSGSYFQEVPMVKIISGVYGPVNIRTSSSSFDFHAPDDFAIISPAIEKSISIDSSEMIFAGFGIVAPEYGWDDYSGLDVKGKTVVVMVNDPGLYSGDTSLFKGSEMTYYGRWTYKYEEAARQGALGILIIHESKGAGYDYTIPRKSSITPNLYIQSDGSNTSRCRFTGWISAETAEKIFGTKATDVSGLRAKAYKKGFSGFSTGTYISLRINNTVEYNKSKNVAGILKGTERPERSIILLFPTSEEDGLAGSLYYTDHPVFPIQKCVACLNNDLLLPLGRMKDVMITGYGQSELDDFVRDAATEQDRYVTGDPNPHTGMYFRSDHFSFAKKGVPSLFARGNTDSREFGKKWAAEMEQEYIRNRYHKPSDNYQPEKWNLEGIAEDAALGFSVGYKIATSEVFPRWKRGSEFKKIREKSQSK